MDYDLNEPGGGDTISCGSLYVGGSLAFSNFGFGYTSNFGPGVYDLIYSTSLPSNLLGNSTSGLVDGYPANLAVRAITWCSRGAGPSRSAAGRRMAWAVRFLVATAERRTCLA